MEPIENLYFNWLCAKVVYLEVKSPSLTHDHLLRKLYRTEYVWTVIGDDNRVEDGLDLRSKFLRTSNIEDDGDWLHYGCSVLEALIAFSNRLEFDSNIPAEQWFWHMIENLGIHEFNDARYIYEDLDTLVDDVLDALVWRQYDRYGNGGLFPLQNTKKDQREIEIWYQYCAYWEEHNYII